jgi:hypothetical protein
MSEKYRAIPWSGGVLVVRAVPQTASENPLTAEERCLVEVADQLAAAQERIHQLDVALAEQDVKCEQLESIVAKLRFANEMYVCPACQHLGSYSDWIAHEDHTCTHCHEACYELRYWVDSSTRAAAALSAQEAAK